MWPMFSPRKIDVCKMPLFLSKDIIIWFKLIILVLYLSVYFLFICLFWFAFSVTIGDNVEPSKCFILWKVWIGKYFAYPF